VEDIKEKDVADIKEKVEDIKEKDVADIKDKAVQKEDVGDIKDKVVQKVDVEDIKVEVVAVEAVVEDIKEDADVAEKVDKVDRIDLRKIKIVRIINEDKISLANFDRVVENTIENLGNLLKAFLTIMSQTSLKLNKNLRIGINNSNPPHLPILGKLGLVLKLKLLMQYLLNGRI